MNKSLYAIRRADYFKPEAQEILRFVTVLECGSIWVMVAMTNEECEKYGKVFPIHKI